MSQIATVLSSSDRALLILALEMAIIQWRKDAQSAPMLASQFEKQVFQAERLIEDIEI